MAYIPGALEGISEVVKQCPKHLLHVHFKSSGIWGLSNFYSPDIHFDVFANLRSREDSNSST